jgi:hypothetical protein
MVSPEYVLPHLMIVPLLQEMCPAGFCGIQSRETKWRACGTPSVEENCLVDCDVM